MSKAVYILSKRTFEEILKSHDLIEDNIEKMDKYAFISINDSNGTYYHEPFFKKDYNNFITLHFDDITKEGDLSPTNRGTTKIFSEKDAEKIVKFVKENTGKIFIVHCAAGISRSGAVGTFINDFCNYDYEQFKKDNPFILPNQYILSILKNKANEIN